MRTKLFCLAALAMAPACSDPIASTRTDAPPEFDADSSCRHAQIKLNDIFRGGSYFSLRPVGAHIRGDLLHCLFTSDNVDVRMTATITCNTPKRSSAEMIYCLKLETLEKPYGTFIYGEDQCGTKKASSWCR